MVTKKIEATKKIEISTGKIGEGNKGDEKLNSMTQTINLMRTQIRK